MSSCQHCAATGLMRRKTPQDEALATVEASVSSASLGAGALRSDARVAYVSTLVSSAAEPEGTFEIGIRGLRPTVFRSRPDSVDPSATAGWSQFTVCQYANYGTSRHSSRSEKGGDLSREVRGAFE